MEFIKKIFGKIFNKDTVKKIAEGEKTSEKNELNFNRNKLDFIDSIKIEKTIRQLFEEFEKGIISKESLTEDQKKKIMDQYAKEISEIAKKNKEMLIKKIKADLPQ